MMKTIFILILVFLNPIFSFAESFSVMFPISTPSSSSFIVPDNNTFNENLRYTESLSILLKGDSGFGIGFKNFEYRKKISYPDDFTDEELINFKALELPFSLAQLTLGFGQIIEGNVKIEKNIRKKLSLDN